MGVVAFSLGLGVGADDEEEEEEEDTAADVDVLDIVVVFIVEYDGRVAAAAWIIWSGNAGATVFRSRFG